MTKPARPSVKKDPSRDFLNPDTNFLKILGKLAGAKDPASQGKKENEYVGSIEYRVVGTTTMVTVKEAMERDPNATSKVGRVKNAILPGLDINYITADPFYDGKIDEDRVRNKGKLEYSQIQDRVSFFLYSEGLYHVLFPRKKVSKATGLEKFILEEEVIASFLLRVDFDKSQYGGVTSKKGEKFAFKFNDRDNLREPELVKHIPRSPNSGPKEKRA